MDLIISIYLSFGGGRGVVTSMYANELVVLCRWRLPIVQNPLATTSTFARLLNWHRVVIRYSLFYLYLIGMLGGGVRIEIVGFSRTTEEPVVKSEWFLMIFRFIPRFDPILTPLKYTFRFPPPKHFLKQWLRKSPQATHLLLTDPTKQPV